MNTFFSNFIDNGDLETFYPFQMGVGKGAPNNFESSYDEDSDPDLDDRNDDQENIEYEDEALEVGGIEETQQLPCFRQLVRDKKRQLRDTYGKGKLSIGECGIQPIRTEPKYNPQVRIPKIYSPIKDCGLNPDLRPGLFKVPCVCTKTECNCAVGKNCCQYNRQKEIEKASAWAAYTACRAESGKLLNPGIENEDAWARAQDRFNADTDAWRKCRSENKGIWTPGWRKQWRKFKKEGGLTKFKQESTRCILGKPVSNEPILTPPTPVPTTTTAIPTISPTQMQSLKDKISKLKFVESNVALSKGGKVSKSSAEETSNKSKYIVIIAIVLVVAVAAYMIYRIRKK